MGTPQHWGHHDLHDEKIHAMGVFSVRSHHTPHICAQKRQTPRWPVVYNHRTKASVGMESWPMTSHVGCRQSTFSS